MLALNHQWIEQMMQQGRRVIDIGPDFCIGTRFAKKLREL